MEKTTKIKEYIERIREEIRYNDYAHAKELCIRASYIDGNNLCVKYLREFIELHKKNNGRYAKLTLNELCGHLFRGRNYITAENWESISAYISCLADEVSEGEPMTMEDFYALGDSKMYLEGYIERLGEIIEQLQIEGRIINWLKKAMENLKEKVVNIATSIEEEQENERRKKERERLMIRWTCGIGGGIMFLILMIATCTGRMTW